MVAQALSEPRRYPRRLPAHAQQFAAFVQFSPFEESISPDRWQVPFQEPIRRLRQIRTAQHEFEMRTDIAPALHWFQPLSEPVRFRPMLPIRAQQFAAFVQFAPFVEDVTADRWFPPFSEPRRYRRALPTFAQQFAAYQGFAPFEEAVTSDRWQPPLSEPVRFRRRLLAPEHQFAAFVQFSPFTEAITADRWAPPFSQPRIYPRMLPLRAQQFAIWAPWPVVLDQPLIAMVASIGFEMSPFSRFAEMLEDGEADKAFAAIIKPWFLSDRT